MKVDRRKVNIVCDRDETMRIFKNDKAGLLSEMS